MTNQPELPDAARILTDAADTLTARGQQRDQPEGERSMARTVAAFNVIHGSRLTETQGWQFMALLKVVRGTAGVYNADDHTDHVGYAALAGESAAREHAAPSPEIAARYAAFVDAQDEMDRLRELLAKRPHRPGHDC